MTDNVTFATGDPATPPAATVVATDNIAGINYQRVKVVWGGDGTATDADTANGAALPAQLRDSTGTEIATATNPLRTDPTGTTAQPVTDNGGSLTVDNAGTFAVQATQAGTWNVTNISGTVSLPTGAATAAKQPALGTAGTASADVITVQGIASMTALKVDNSGVTQPVSNAGTFAVQAAQSGTWNVTNISGTISLPTGASTAANQTATQGTTGSAAPSKGVLVQGSDGTNARNLSTTTGGVLKVDLSATAANATAVKVDNSAVTQPVSGTVTANAGTGSFTVAQATAASLNATVVGTGTFATQAAQSGTWTIQPGNTANTTPWLVTQTPATSGGVSSSWNSIKATATSVKASAGQVYGWHIYNSNSSAIYVQFFNTASGSVTLGTTTPVYSIGIPASGGATVTFASGIAHSTAITIAATTTATGSTAPSNNVDINIFYK